MAVGTRSGYRTKQGALVDGSVASCGDGFFTARDIHDALEAAGSPVGMATIYRHLEQLVEQGQLTKSTVEGTGGARFRRVEAAGEPCLYFKCELCGSLEPMECSHLMPLYEHFADEHGVSVDAAKTVLFGTCAECLRGESGCCAGAESGASKGGAGVGGKGGAGKGRDVETDAVPGRREEDR